MSLKLALGRGRDLLLELDPAEAAADARSAGDGSNADLAEIDRRHYAIDTVRAAQAEETRESGQRDAAGGPDSADGAQAVAGPVERLAGRTDLKIDWDVSLPESFRLREEAVLHADLAQLSGSLNALDKQMAQKLATQKRLDMSIAFQHTLMDTMNQRVSTRQQAIDLKVGTKIDLYDAKEELEKSQAQLASDEGQRSKPTRRRKRFRARRRRPFRNSSPTIRTSSPRLRARPTRRVRLSPRRLRDFNARNSMRRSTASYSRRPSPPLGRL